MSDTPVRRCLHTQDEVSIEPPDVEAIRRAPKSVDVVHSVERWLADARQRNDIHYFAIMSRGAPIGQILLHDVDPYTKSALVAYHLFERHDRGRGVGTMALRLLVRFVQNNTDLTKLVIITARDNKASQRIAAKCGFIYVGTPRENPIDGVVYQWERPS